jgi:hypothetical protein
LILFYRLKHLAPAEKLGFSLVAVWLPDGCQVVNKTAKNKDAKTATSRVNTDF